MRPASLIRLALTVLPVLATGVLVSPPAYAGPGEYDFVALTNSARASAGLAPYAVAGDLSAVARSWAAHMAATRTLSHNPSLSSQVANWADVGENIGYGAGPAAITGMFLNSAPHRANILSSTFSQIGVGTATASDGSLWVSEVFRLPLGAAPPAAPPPPPPAYVVGPRASRDRPVAPVAAAPAPAGDPQGPLSPPPPPPPPPPAAAAAPVDPTVLLAARLQAAAAGRPDPDARDPLRRALDYASTMSVLTDAAPAA